MDAFLKTWYGIVLFAVFDFFAFFTIVCITYRYFFKRVFDFFTALVCLIFTSPLFLVVWIRGKRAKKRGEILSIVQADEFVCKKGRVKDLHSFAYLGADGKVAGKYGAWLDRTRLFKLLRLWDIFCGRLSFIGPRAFTEAECERLTDIQMDRCLPRPGVINPLAVSGDEDVGYAEMLRSDEKYAWNFSFFMDCKIFFTWLLRAIRGENGGYLGKTRTQDFCAWADSQTEETPQ